jgi:hypothetical protein
MPWAANVEDRTVPGANVFPSRPHDELGRLKRNPFGATYNMDQWDYLQHTLPGGQPPVTPLADPSFSLDPSIFARAKAARYGPPPGWGESYLPTPSPPGLTLNSWGPG